MTSRAAIFIPARYGSSRLPGKPLADIAGRPMIERVYDCARAVKGVSSVTVLTDDRRVEHAVKAFGGNVLMTDAGHLSGTDRLAEAMHTIPAEIYINIQGDEPLLRSSDVEYLLEMMAQNPEVSVGTLAHHISTQESLDKNNVKVILNSFNDALYFSRAQIPFPRLESSASYLKHIGVYAYRYDALATYRTLVRPAIEDAEQLEQLRLLYAGLRVRVLVVDTAAPGVDTPEDLAYVRKIFSSKGSEKY